MRQRGMRTSDVELIIGCATLVGDDVYFLSFKDAEREICRRKREIQTLQRLRNRKVVVACDRVVTCYRSRSHDQKCFLRKERELT